MATLKLTKTELRNQQQRLGQLEKYLPTLQLKKSMLQTEVNDARQEITKAEEGYYDRRRSVDSFSSLLSDTYSTILPNSVKVKELSKHYENIAGVEVPYFDSITFQDYPYSLFDTPAWLDSAINTMRGAVEGYARVEIAREKKAALENELRQVSIRVNLFEKILIPRAKTNIKKIKVFLGDLELASVGRAKVAKTKIELAKMNKEKVPYAD